MFQPGRNRSTTKSVAGLLLAVMATLLAACGAPPPVGKPRVAFLQGPELVDPNFCRSSATCRLGDVNGDSKTDLIAIGLGVQVHLGGTSGSQVWLEGFCTILDRCDVGDFNGDGKTDLIRFAANLADPNLAGRAYVALSTGTSFAPPTLWGSLRCQAGMTCVVGEFNTNPVDSPRRDDVAVFFRSKYTDQREGDVFVYASNGTTFSPGTKVHEGFCYEQDICMAANIGAASQDDLIAIVRSPRTGLQIGDVLVAEGQGTTYALPRELISEACPATATCVFTGMGDSSHQSLAVFLQNTYNDVRRNDVLIARNTNGQLGPLELGHEDFCRHGEICLPGRDPIYVLYSFTRDALPGDATGDVKVLWFLQLL